MNCTIEKIRQAIKLDDLDKSELIEIINDIKEALLREHPLATTHDDALIKQEEIARVLLGLGLTNPCSQTFSGRSSRSAKLRSSIAELTEQINNLQGSILNTSALKVFYVLLLNGRGNELRFL